MVVWNSLRGKPPPFLFLFFFFGYLSQSSKNTFKKTDHQHYPEKCLLL